MKPIFLVSGVLFSLFTLSACSLSPERDGWSKLTFNFSSDPSSYSQLSPSLVAQNNPGLYAVTAPTSMSDFQCVGVNVVGYGIPAANAHDRPEERLPKMFAGSSCAYPGITSTPLSSSQDASLDLIVPSGPQRIVQVVGVTDPALCAMTVPIGSVDIKTNNAVYELGRGVVDLYGDKSITIENTYKNLATQPERDARLVDCGGDQSNGGQRQLKLVAVYTGITMSSTTPTSSALASDPFAQIASFLTFPPPTMDGSDPAEGGFSPFSYGTYNTDGTFTTTPSKNNMNSMANYGGSVVDFFFDRDFEQGGNAIIASNYSKLIINAMGCGSTSSSGGSCSMGLSHVEMAVRGAGSWSTKVITSGTTPVPLNLTIPSAGYSFAYSGAPNGNLVHVSIRANTSAIGATQASYVEVASLKAYLGN
jgi:hypothetical protein